MVIAVFLAFSLTINLLEAWCKFRAWKALAITDVVAVVVVAAAAAAIGVVFASTADAVDGADTDGESDGKIELKIQQID